jgi:hypothetical protein
MKTRPIPSPFSRLVTEFRLLVLIAVTTILSAQAMAAIAQTNGADNNPGPPPKETPTLAQQARAFEQATENIRAACLQGRRIICGRIVKISPDGLIVDSGYTSLMRPPLNKFWLVPGTVHATREANLVEGSEPGSVCVGLVFLTAVPTSRATKPKPYDYVVIQAYPAGQYTYTSAGTIRRTVRRFSASLSNAMLANRAAAGIQPPVPVADAK